MSTLAHSHVLDPKCNGMLALWRTWMTSAETAKARLVLVIHDDRYRCPCWVWRRQRNLEKSIRFGGKPIFRLTRRT